MEQVPDEHLERYLLGDLAEDEAERLDQRSVADAAFALRLRGLEDDLVDRYVRGGPYDPSLERFDRLHRDSPHLRDKVRFARALQAVSAGGRASAPAPPGHRRSTSLWTWGMGIAACLLTAVAAYLLLANMRLRAGVDQLESRRAVEEARTAHLEQELASARRELAPAGSSPAFDLRSPRRGPENDVTTVTLPKGARQVTLRLRVDSDEYTTFWAALKSLGTAGVDWRSPDLRPEGAVGSRTVVATIPAEVLRAQRYAVELSGVSRDGTAEPAGTYLIRVVLE